MCLRDKILPPIHNAQHMIWYVSLEGLPVLKSEKKVWILKRHYLNYPFSQLLTDFQLILPPYLYANITLEKRYVLYFPSHINTFNNNLLFISLFLNLIHIFHGCFAFFWSIYLTFNISVIACHYLILIHCQPISALISIFNWKVNKKERCFIHDFMVLVFDLTILFA